MPDELPPPRDPALADLLAQTIKDDALDHQNARDQIAAMTQGQQMARLISLEAQQMAAQRNDKLVGAWQGGMSIGKREAAVYILAGMAASTKMAARKQALKDSLTLLDELDAGTL